MDLAALVKGINALRSDCDIEVKSEGREIVTLEREVLLKRLRQMLDVEPSVSFSGPLKDKTRASMYGMWSACVKGHTPSQNIVRDSPCPWPRDHGLE